MRFIQLLRYENVAQTIYFGNQIVGSLRNYVQLFYFLKSHEDAKHNKEKIKHQSFLDKTSNHLFLENLEFIRAEGAITV